jgi:hypothetical protein
MLAARISREAALAGAIALMFSGPVFSLIDISNNLTTLAWLPWVIWSALDRSSSRRAGVFLALAFLGGEPFYAGVAALLYALIVRTPRRIAETGLYAFGLSAVQLLPFLEMLRGSDRAAGLPADQLFRDSASLRDWLRMAVPPTLTVDVVDPSLSQHFIAVVYIGMATLILAAIGVTLGRKKEVVPWLLLLAAAIVVSAGNTLRPVAFLLEHFPVTLFRYPARMIPIGAIAIAALAAMGWDRVRPGRRVFDVVVIALLLVEVAPSSMRLLASVPFKPADPYARDVAASSKLLRVGNRVGADRYAWIAGYLNLYSHRFDSWSAAPVMPDRYGRFFLEAFGGVRLDLVDRLPAGWILAQQDLGSRFEPVSVLRGVKLFRNRHALPMATLWASVRGAVDADAALAGSLDARNAGDVYVSPPPSLKPVNRRAIVPARLTQIDSSSATVEVESSFPGVLVLTQRDAPGWRVSVDGVPSRKLLADGNFRAVQVEAGRHVVTWRYLPLSLILGAAMTCVTLAFMQLSAFVKRRSSSKFS